MISGKVTANRESVVELETIGPDQKKERVETAIDTGFNGDLTLAKGVGNLSQATTGWESEKEI